MRIAQVYKRGALAGRLERDTNETRFAYDREYIDHGGEPIATTLPLSDEPVTTPPGSVPPYFAGLLPEGRRLTALARHLKISLDDEFSLLVAVGANAVGDVVVGNARGEEQAVELPPSLKETRFADLASGVPEHAGVAGVQEKVTGRMISLPAKFAGAEYILKLNPPEFPRLAENEAYFLDLAGRCGIAHAEGQILEDRDGESALLVTRFDRGPDGESYALEDGCQVLGRWPADKYLVNYEQLTDGLVANCAAGMVALRDLFAQITFAIITGNGDAHAKNFSILRTSDEWRIAPAYDLPSTVFYGDATLALSLGTGTQPPGRRSLMKFASTIGLPEAAATRTIESILDGTRPMISEIEAGAIGLDGHRTNAGLDHLRLRRRQLESIQ